jgi:uncharacterized protein YbdZ (MbtH family)
MMRHIFQSIARCQRTRDAITIRSIAHATTLPRTMSGDELLPYRVIANCEDAYAVWSTARPIPSAWRAIGVQGSLHACLAYINLIERATQSRIIRCIVEQDRRCP